MIFKPFIIKSWYSPFSSLLHFSFFAFYLNKKIIFFCWYEIYKILHLQIINITAIILPNVVQTVLFLILKGNNALCTHWIIMLCRWHDRTYRKRFGSGEEFGKTLSNVTTFLVTLMTKLLRNKFWNVSIEYTGSIQRNILHHFQHLTKISYNVH